MRTGLWVELWVGLSGLMSLQAAERRGPRVSSFLWGFHVRHDGAVRFSETHKLTGLQSCQPWSYLRLVAYSFVGSCEGA